MTTTYKIKHDFRKILQIFDEQSNTWHFQHPYTYEKHYSNENWFSIKMCQQSNVVFQAWIKPGVGEIDIRYRIERECELDFINRIMEELQ